MTAKRIAQVRTWGIVLSVVIGIVAYLLGWSGWQVALLFLGFPLLALFHWMATGPDWIRRYRFLLVVYGLALVPAAYELWVTRKIPETMIESLEIKPGSGEGDLFFEYDFPRELSAVYPRRTESLFAQGVQIHLCLNRRDRMRIARCRRLEEISPEEVRRLLEQSLATGARGNEDLLYHYAMFLVESRAEQTQIDDACNEWKRHYPFSRRPDPRELFQP